MIFDVRTHGGLAPQTRHLRCRKRVVLLESGDLACQ